MTGTGGDWWRAAFTEHYSEVYHHRDDVSAAAEIAGLLPRLRAAPGPVLDACCGGGRHLAAMRAAGLDAYGFDFSPALLAKARTRQEVDGHVVRADMRAPPFAGGFGAITLLFTAFGYFDDDGNADCLTAIARLLDRDGWLVLDMPDLDRTVAGLVPSSTRTTPNGLVVHERRRMIGNRVEKSVEIVRAGDQAVMWSESVRLYSAIEVAGLALRAGLMVSETWPGLQGPERDGGRAVYWLRPKSSVNEEF